VVWRRGRNAGNGASTDEGKPDTRCASKPTWPRHHQTWPNRVDTLSKDSRVAGLDLSKMGPPVLLGENRNVWEWPARAVVGSWVVEAWRGPQTPQPPVAKV
jgi:hypothetical protein